MCVSIILSKGWKSLIGPIMDGDGDSDAHCEFLGGADQGPLASQAHLKGKKTLLAIDLVANFQCKSLHGPYIFALGKKISDRMFSILKSC